MESSGSKLSRLGDFPQSDVSNTTSRDNRPPSKKVRRQTVKFPDDEELLRQRQHTEEFFDSASRAGSQRSGSSHGSRTSNRSRTSHRSRTGNDSRIIRQLDQLPGPSHEDREIVYVQNNTVVEEVGEHLHLDVPSQNLIKIDQNFVKKMSKRKRVNKPNTHIFSATKDCVEALIETTTNEITFEDVLSKISQSLSRSFLRKPSPPMIEVIELIGKTKAEDEEKMTAAQELFHLKDVIDKIDKSENPEPMTIDWEFLKNWSEKVSELLIDEINQLFLNLSTEGKRIDTELAKQLAPQAIKNIDDKILQAFPLMVPSLLDLGAISQHGLYVLFGMTIISDRITSFELVHHCFSAWMKTGRTLYQLKEDKHTNLRVNWCLPLARAVELNNFGKTRRVVDENEEYASALYGLEWD